jgi:multidrug resistance efflux pump
MLTCKQVSEALAHKNYSELPRLKRWALLLHVKLCPICGKFNQQIMRSQEMFSRYKELESSGAHSQHNLKRASKEQLKKQLQQAMEAQSKQQAPER